MNYIGSKLKLSAFLLSSIELTLAKDKIKLQDCVFCDIFAGTGIVNRLFKDKVKQIISNDKEYYSFILNQGYNINNLSSSKLNDLFEELQSDVKTPPIEGKIYLNYCLGNEKFTQTNYFQKDNLIPYKRQYFTDYNGAKIDAIRIKIQSWKDSGNIDESLYYYLLASLLESADKIANTASVYGAFLKKFKKSAMKNIILTPIPINESQTTHQVYCEDTLKLIKQIKGDILYLDPPYNAREYGANYHILNTIALYDDFIPAGKTGLRPYTKSNFCKKITVAQALEDTIRLANFQYIFLSYNDEGLLNLDQIESMFRKYGSYNIISQQHQRFKADSSRIHKQHSTIEYLHILKKDMQKNR
ncbi:DNA adenine methylase [Helicobacter sp. 13S00477-4]|uniref:DNA adenine methylase n=1 Tax=Helicobacter sp. 13S00477-4 TaxID=1905759 RepID=UPI000BA60461|nr:DNA adenine methylase [Helicobacter sp. 13S00477-4]PAF50691.1 modification methylase [Helicobacter sp. 13S00477-4]